MNISIVEFNKNISKILARVVESNEEIAIFKHNKPYVVINSCKNKSMQRENLASSIPQNKANLQELHSQIQSIENNTIQNTIQIKTEYCLACKKLGRKREAVELVSVYEDGQERKVWLCGICKNKYSVYV